MVRSWHDSLARLFAHLIPSATGRNQGQTRCENCGIKTVPAQQHKKGVTPPTNETHVDHVIPRVEGGKGEPDNGQVLCRDCNLKKGDKTAEPPRKTPAP